MYMPQQLLHQDVIVEDPARILELVHVQNSMGVISHMYTRMVDGKTLKKIMFHYI